MRRRWLYVLLGIVVGGGAGAAAIVLTTPQFEASATVYFSVPAASSANDLAQGGNYAQQQLTSYAQLATEPIVLDPVIEHLDLDQTADQLAGAVTAVASNNTVLITISATDPSADRAAAIANAVSDELGSTVSRLSPKSESGRATVDYAIAGRAAAPLYPSSPRKKVDLGAGLLGGLIIGVLAAVTRDRLDTRIWGESDIKELPSLARIPFDKGADKSGHSPLIADWDEGSARAEAFRQLRTAIQFADVDNPMKIVAVTSSMSGEGKSGVSANLAMAFAEAGHRVLLMDADLRRPSIADYFGLEGSRGLTNALVGQVDIDDVIQGWGDRHRLSVLPAGAVPPNPSEILGSQRMAAMLDDFRSGYDVIVIDTPPLLPVTDAAIIAAKADGALVIARYGKTKRQEFAGSTDALRAVDARIVGAVINRVPTKKRGAAYDYYGAVSETAPAAAPVPADGRVASEPPNNPARAEHPVDDEPAPSPARAVDPQRSMRTSAATPREQPIRSS
ncbi:polysaccharide biosynthesis tyrosine autokinase [Microlunatus soli]|uniref:polysaccharide biosynthesis tyrosine autokinase n=1 Tax=Microlunatus soli TaxID=630515 RepID=UPI0012F89D7D|nr:polysaccharide biosynthesis tyrosine autokinase [Microlunatus soli]